LQCSVFVSGARAPQQVLSESDGSRDRRQRRRPRGSDVVVVGVRDQGQVARALDRGRQLALVLRLGAGDPGRDDLAGLGDVLAQGVEILVIDLDHALGGELAELAAAEELGHGCAPQAASSLSSAAALASSPLASPSSSSRRRRSPRSGRSPPLSPLSSLFFMISDCSVMASSRRITMWRRIASLKRKVSTSSSSTAWPASMLSST